MSATRRGFLAGLGALLGARALLAAGFAEQVTSVSLRKLTEYTVGEEQLISRLDVLYGYMYVRPEWSHTELPEWPTQGALHVALPVPALT